MFDSGNRPHQDGQVVKINSVPASNSTLDLFLRTGAYLKGHFRLTSGLHSPEYLQCALVLQYPAYAEMLGRSLARSLQSQAEGRRIEVVASPAIGGLIIGHEVARALAARFVFCERGNDRRMTLRRGFQVQPGETVAVVEDVITTGGSSREVIEVMMDAGATVLGAGSVIDRSNGEADLGVPRTALATLRVISYAETLCPLCKQGVPVEKPGSRPVGTSAP